MAIVLEGEKKNVDWGFILGILFIVAIIGSAIVYLFFVNPEIVQQQFTTSDQKRLNEFSKTKFNPGATLSSPAFQGLKTATPMITPAEGDVGKTNLFLPQ